MILFKFINSYLSPLADGSSEFTLTEVLLNHLYLLPKNWPHRDARIEEHSANIRATIEHHAQLKAQRRGRNQEAPQHVFDRHIEECEKQGELVRCINIFLFDEANTCLLEHLREFGLHNDEASWNNPTSLTGHLRNFLRKNGVNEFNDAVQFLQDSSFFAKESTIIPTRRNPNRSAFAFIFKEAPAASAAADLSATDAAPAASAADATPPHMTNAPCILLKSGFEDEEYDLIISAAIKENQQAQAQLKQTEQRFEAQVNAKKAAMPKQQPALTAEKEPEVQSAQKINKSLVPVIAEQLGVSKESVKLLIHQTNPSLTTTTSFKFIEKAKMLDLSKLQDAAPFKEESNDDMMAKKRVSLLARLAQQRAAMLSKSASTASSASGASAADDSPLIESLDIVSPHTIEAVEFLNKLKPCEPLLAEKK